MSEYKPGTYGFYPDGHGQYSFFTTANSEEEAFAIVSKEVERLRAGGNNNYFIAGWGTDYYCVEYAPIGQVLVNNND